MEEYLKNEFRDKNYFPPEFFIFLIRSISREAIFQFSFVINGIVVQEVIH